MLLFGFRKLLPLALLVATGCVVEVPFEPLGADAALSTRWTFGERLVTQQQCEDRGIDKVQMVFVNSGEIFAFDKFMWDCKASAYDSRPKQVLKYGIYRLQFRLINKIDLAVYIGDEIEVNISSPSDLLEIEYDFPTLE